MNTALSISVILASMGAFISVLATFLSFKLLRKSDVQLSLRVKFHGTEFMFKAKDVPNITPDKMRLFTQHIIDSLDQIEGFDENSGDNPPSSSPK